MPDHSIAQITREGNHLVIGHGADIPNDIYFPVNYALIKNLMGKLLTIVDLAVPAETQNDAAKSLTRQAISQWFNDVQENSLTSYRGCIAPIEVLRGSEGKDRKYIWHGEGNHAVSVS